MKYKQSFLDEVKRFAKCGESGGGDETRPPTEAGLEQFFLYESKGIKPTTPDPHFTRLVNGGKWWEWTLNMIAEKFGTSEEKFCWCEWECKQLS